MSTTMLICTQCGELIDVTADTVRLPFICMQCEKSAEEFDLATQRYEDMAPGAPTITHTFPAAGAYSYTPDGKVDTAYDAPDPYVAPEPFNAGLDDLDQEPNRASGLSDEFASVENTTLLIEDLEKQLVEAQTLGDDRLVEINGLEFQLNRAEAAIMEIVVKSLEEMVRLTRRAKKAEMEAQAERSKSLWQRFKEATYDRLP